MWNYILIDNVYVPSTFTNWSVMLLSLYKMTDKRWGKNQCKDGSLLIHCLSHFIVVCWVLISLSGDGAKNHKRQQEQRKVWWGSARQADHNRGTRSTDPEIWIIAFLIWIPLHHIAVSPTAALWIKAVNWMLTKGSGSAFCIWPCTLIVC